MFDEVDLQKNGYIAMEDWIAYTTEHIIGKVASIPAGIQDPKMDPTMNGTPNGLQISPYK